MYKLLVVDDEPIIVDGLYELFREMKSYPLDVYKAYSGDEALDWLSKKRIDVVVTDIKMPGIDGMQLLERIRYSWPDCRVVFLTGHDEFAYIYKAIGYDGVSYLLKNESYEKIIETVEGFLEQIHKSLKDDALVQKAKSQLQKAIPILQKEFLTELIDGVCTNVSQQQLDDLGIPLQANSPVIMIAGYASEVSDKANSNERPNYYTVNFIAEKHMEQYASITYSVYKNYMLWILQERKNAEGAFSAPVDNSVCHFRGILESVQAVCRETLKLNVSFVISSKAVAWHEVAYNFVSLKAMLNNCSESGMEAVLIEGNSLDGESGAQFNINRTIQSVKLQLKKLESLDSFLEQGRKEGFFSAFKEIRSALLEKVNDASVSYEIFYSLSLLFISYINRHGISEAVSTWVDYDKLTQFDRYKSMEDAFDYFEQAAVHFFDIQNVEQERRSVAAVQKVQKHIQDHTGGDLSLSSLADLVYFNPKYLSRLFKQETGLNLSDFILEVKLNKVKELLRKKGMKVHEVAEYAGYFSAPCFTRFFKKATGITPHEYRDSFLAGS